MAHASIAWPQEMGSDLLVGLHLRFLLHGSLGLHALRTADKGNIVNFSLPMKTPTLNSLTALTWKTVISMGVT